MCTDKRKKSAGGVFLTLLKKDSRFTPELRKKVFKVEKERRKQRKTATDQITKLTLECEGGSQQMASESSNCTSTAAAATVIVASSDSPNIIAAADSSKTTEMMIIN